MRKKIMICGASGTGKTTLAKHMSELYEIPYVTTSAKAVWPKFGFKNHEDAIRQSAIDPKIGYDYQVKILQNRAITLAGEAYVTDRSFIDNITYMLLSVGHAITTCETEDFIDICSEKMKGIDGVIYLKWGYDILLEDDGNRVKNPYYQVMVDRIISHIIEDNLILIPCPILTLNMWHFSLRIQLVDKWLKRL